MADQTLRFDLLGRDMTGPAFNSAGKNAGQLESKFSKISSGMVALGRVAATGAVAVGAIGVAAAGFGLKTAAANEQAMISFTTMLGSAKKAGAFLKQLQQFAAKTPFEFPELQTAASSLISAGFHAKQVIPIMTTLGDVTSGMGTGSEGVKRATVALQQMSAAGKITGEDLNQLRDAGIPVFDLLASATGKSKAEISALAQTGKLGKKEMDALFKALETGGGGLERFTGLMAKQSQSLTGLWSTFKDTLGQGLATAITPLIPLIKDGLGKASEFLGTALAKLPAILTTVMGWFHNLSGAVSGNGSAISGLIGWVTGSLIPAFRQVADTLLPKLQNLFHSVSDTISQNKGTFQALGAYLTGIIIPVVGRVAGIVIDILGPAFKGAMAVIRTVVIPGFSAMAEVFLVAVGVIVNGAAKALGWIPGLGPKLKGAAASFNTFKDDTLATLRTMSALARGVGADIVSGLSVGMLSKQGVAIATAQGIVNKSAAAMRAAAATASPSKVTMKIGEFFAEGFAIGTKKGQAKALTAVQSLITKVTDKLRGLRQKAAEIRSSAAGAVSGMFNWGGIGETTTTPGGTDAEGNALPDTSTTANPVAQFADFASKSGAFATAVARAASVLGTDHPEILAQAVGTGNLTVVQALAALSPSSAASVNRDFTLAQGFAAQVGQTILSTTPVPEQIAREAERLAVLKELRDSVKNARPNVHFTINDATDPDKVVAAIRKYIKKNGLLKNVTA